MIGIALMHARTMLGVGKADYNTKVDHEDSEEHVTSEPRNKDEGRLDDDKKTKRMLPVSCVCYPKNAKTSYHGLRRGDCLARYGRK